LETWNRFPGWAWWQFGAGGALKMEDQDAPTDEDVGAVDAVVDAVDTVDAMNVVVADVAANAAGAAGAAEAGAGTGDADGLARVKVASLTDADANGANVDAAGVDEDAKNAVRGNALPLPRADALPDPADVDVAPALAELPDFGAKNAAMPALDAAGVDAAAAAGGVEDADGPDDGEGFAGAVKKVWMLRCFCTNSFQ
jgi:hypothetical protein